MKPFQINIAFALALVACATLGAVQGKRLDSLQDSETFYRWLISASTLARVDNTLEYNDPSRPDDQPALDDELFAKILDRAEGHFADAPALESSDNAQGEDYVDRELVRAAAASMDDEIWDFATSSDNVDLRDEFLLNIQQGNMQSVGEQLSMAMLYGKADGGEAYDVGITNLFFGFRKVAANFMWLQVDKFWHQGNYHRMVPLMQMCVTLDPNFTDAYLLGAWHLAYNVPAKIQATPERLKTYNDKYGKRLGLREQWFYLSADFLKDGIRKNPRDYRLYFDLGYAVYDAKMQDWPNAVRWLGEATRYRHVRQVPRRLNVALQMNGQYEDAIKGWEEYIEDFPTNVVAPRLLKVCQAYRSVAIAKEAEECSIAAQAAAEDFAAKAAEARAAGNETAANEFDAERLRAEESATNMTDLAEFQTATARTIWSELGPEDALGQARLLMMDAQEYLEKGQARTAIQILKEARWKSAKVFEEASNIIISISKEKGYPFTTSERLELARQEDAALFRQEDNRPVIKRVECEYSTASD